jgi:L-aspartate oxidase
MPATPPLSPPSDAAAVRGIVSRCLGIVRNAIGLEEGIAALLPLARESGPAADPAVIGLMMAVAALGRQESRGAHFRTDFPRHAATARHTRLTLEEAFALAGTGWLAPPHAIGA